jgi:hypothetical protein
MPNKKKFPSLFRTFRKNIYGTYGVTSDILLITL